MPLIKLQAEGLNLADTFNFTGTLQQNSASIGGTNTPAFFAYLSSNTNVTGATATKITFDSELYDTDSAYDVSNGRFTVPSNEGGKYLVASTIWCAQAGGEGKLYLAGVRLYKNGSLFMYSQTDFNTAGDDSANNHGASFVAPINLAASDYLEIYAIVGAHTGQTQVFSGTASTWFSVQKLIT